MIQFKIAIINKGEVSISKKNMIPILVVKKHHLAELNMLRLNKM